MEPIFRSFYDLPSRRRTVQAQPDRVVHRVVTIPVRSSESERTRSDAALKIQKAFRGFFVRKSLKKISAIKEEVLAIEQRISNEETVYLIRTNSRERSSVNETLMSLLLRLDSVRAADPGVRDFRRSVIKKAIALQEHLDAVGQPADGAHGTDEDQFSQMTSPDSQTNNVADSELVAEGFNKKEILEEDLGAVESQSGSTQSPAGEEEDGETNGAMVKEEDCELKAESDINGELLKRMVMENEKMMRMMSQLVEKNEKQTRVLSSLTQRVEQLERAFVCDKLRRMKKRSAAADSYPKSPENRKNGKR